jgi:cytoskeleton-associated protein 5
MLLLPLLRLIFACSLTVSLVCSLFGTQVTPPAPILKALPKIFGHSDKAVRSEGTNLAHALYQYLGTGIEPWITDLKPVQVKELKEAWESMEKEGRGKGSLKPERMTRQQARDAEQNADSGAGDAGDGSAAVEGASTILIVYLNVRIMRNRSCTSGSSTICGTS